MFIHKCRERIAYNYKDAVRCLSYVLHCCLITTRISSTCKDNNVAAVYYCTMYLDCQTCTSGLLKNI